MSDTTPDTPATPDEIDTNPEDGTPEEETEETS